MEERKGDPRILIVSGLIFLCIVSGGFLLCLYLFLPESQSRYWYPIAGMILVGIPWAFWFIVCLYNCLKPAKFRANGISMPSNRAPPPPPPTASPTAAAVETPDRGSPGEGQRRVHFGAVVVLAAEGGEEGAGAAAENSSNESHSKEEDPLRASISS